MSAAPPAPQPSRLRRAPAPTMPAACLAAESGALVRLNKRMAELGLASRREADK